MLVNNRRRNNLEALLLRGKAYYYLADTYLEALSKRVAWISKQLYSHDLKINKLEFTDLCDAISFRFEKEVEPSWFERCPNFYHSAPCTSKAFDYIVIF